MRVGFDATAAAWQSAGIGRAAKNLLVAMLRCQDRDIDWVIFYLGQRVNGHFEAALAEFGLIPILVPISPRLGFALWQRLRAPIPIELFTGRLDVLHSPDFVLPFSFARRRLVTIHDLSYLTHPHTADQKLRSRLDRAVRAGLRQADRVICVSQTTADELVELLAYDPARIDVIYNGLDGELAREPTERDQQRVRELGLPDRFVLSVGTLQPRKNLLRVARAVAMLRARGHDLGLIHAGAQGWISSDQLEQIDRAGTGFLTRLGPIDDGLLRALYERATVLAAVSESEGFLLPIIEAMTHSTPVVTANVSCMPEIAGGAALLADPYNEDQIASAIGSAAASGEQRSDLIARGLRRAAVFDWDIAAAATLGAYRSAQAKPGRRR